MSEKNVTPVLRYTLALVVFGAGMFFSSSRTEAATTESVTIQWAANIEPDLAGYRIYQGTSSGLYGYAINVGNITTYAISNLQPEQTYYFAITAYDVHGNESYPSSEVNTNNLSSGETGDSVEDQDGNISSLTISNVAVTSGKSYVAHASGLQAGGVAFIDRAYTFTTVPANVQGAGYIQTANEDKAATTEGFLRFEVNQSVTVYVAHDSRITTKPAWLSTFADTGQDLTLSGHGDPFQLFAQSFPAGTITLGGNASGGGYSMYFVIVQPAGHASLPLYATFDPGVEGFQYRDDVFRETNQPAYAGGSLASVGYSGQGLRVELGGRDELEIWNMSGGWQRTFTLAESTAVQLSFRYNLTQVLAYEPEEVSQVLVTVAGLQPGNEGQDYVAQLAGGGTTGWQVFQTSLGVLPAGTHTLTLGGYNIKKTATEETTEILLDDVWLQEETNEKKENVQLLTVMPNGTGSGTVQSSPSGINCGNTCSNSFISETVVTLTAQPSTDSAFEGWGGDADCSDGHLTMTNAVNCAATFTTIIENEPSPPPVSLLSVSIGGNGKVTSSPFGIECSNGTCSTSYETGTVVTLTPKADPAWKFSDWSGACRGKSECVIQLSTDQFVGATFVQNGNGGKPKK